MGNAKGGANTSMTYSKKHKKLLAWIVAVLIAVAYMPAAPQAAFAADGSMSGDGTEASPYMIEDAADLAKMAEDVNAGTNADAYYKLAADIDLSTVCGAEVGEGTSWTPIGNSSKNFAGTFDGDGHKITGLYIDNSTAGNQGLFGYVNGAVIKDFVLSGEVNVTYRYGNYNAAVVGYAKGSVTLENIGNEANVSTTGNNTAGLVGYVYDDVTIRSCYNKGDITSSGNDVGGLAGYVSYSSLTIEDSYNAGDISSTSTNNPNAGGLLANGYVGSTSVITIKNSFNYGQITGTTNDPIIGKIGGSAAYATITVDNTYYLEGSGASATTEAVSKTAAEFKALARTLGDSWSQGDEYPLLPFEYIKGKASVTGATPDRQQVTQGEAAQELVIEAAGDSKLDPADYALTYQWYEAKEADLSDAEAIDGAVSETYTPTVAADMEAGDYYYYCVVTSTSTADPAAFDAVETASAPSRLDVVSTTPAAAPSVTISKDKEEDTVSQGTEVVFTAEGSVSDPGAGTLSYEWYQTASEEADPETDAKVGEGETFTFKAEDLGDIYTYCVVTNTFENVKTDTAVSEPIKLTVKSREISNAEEFAAFAEAVNGGDTHEGKTVILTDDVDLSEIENWTPVGSSSTNSFRGTFKGEGHAVTGLTITGTDTNRALFGYINGATISDLTVSGSVSGGSYSGGLVAYASGNNTIKNVGNEVKVTCSGSNAGGIVAGISSGKTTIERSYNKADITLTGTGSRVGGIIGSSGTFISYGQITSCYNTGTITTSATSRYNTYAGGLCGGNCPIDNSYNAGDVLHPSYTGDDSYAFSLVGYTSAPTCNSPCYWLDTTAAAAAGGNASEKLVSKMAEELSAAEMVTLLNTGDVNNWIAGAAVKGDGQDYPGLAWEAKPMSELKAEAIAELESYVDLDDYYQLSRNEIDTILSEAEEGIEAADTYAEISAIVSDAKETIDEVPTKAEIDDARDEAMIEIDTYYDPDDYYEAQKSELEAIEEDAIDQIMEAETFESIDDIVAEAKAAIDEIPTAEIMDAAKAEAIEELEYYGSINQYRDAQKAKVEEAVEAGTEAINAAKTLEEIGEACDDAKAVIDAIPTDEEMTKAEAAKESLSDTIIKANSTMASGEYTAESFAALKEAVKAAKEVMDNDEAFESDVNDAKADIMKALLELEPVDKAAAEEEKAYSDALNSLLEALIDVYDNVKPAVYTTGSYAVLEQAAADAEALILDDAATADQLKAARTDILKARKALVKKAANTLKVTAKKKTVNLKKVKARKQTVKAITVKTPVGKVSYKKSSGSAKLTVNAKNGKITVKKGTKKGTYKAKVKVTAAGNGNYKAGSKTVQVVIVVK